MTHILLTGAGFSQNWGGPLAADVFNGLLSDKDLDGPTRELLFAAHDSGGFDRVLANSQLSADPEDKKRYDAFFPDARPSPIENTQQATMQAPQGLDAKHSDELFPVLEFLEEMEDRR
jgi:hypothetical protein